MTTLRAAIATLRSQWPCRSLPVRQQPRPFFQADRLIVPFLRRRYRRLAASSRSRCRQGPAGRSAWRPSGRPPHRTEIAAKAVPTATRCCRHRRAELDPPRAGAKLPTAVKDFPVPAGGLRRYVLGAHVAPGRTVAPLSAGAEQARADHLRLRRQSIGRPHGAELFKHHAKIDRRTSLYKGAAPPSSRP